MENFSKTILLVEDDSITALLEKKILERNNYKVIIAETGERAVEIAEKNSEIDLILMDIDLEEGIDGTEAAEIILKNHNLPLVFLSSHTEPEVVEKTEGITSYGYIVKNSGETVLLASIRMAFRLYDAYIKERDFAEKLLLHSEILNQIEDKVTVTDFNGNITYVNNAVAKTLGRTRSELIGLHIQEFGDSEIDGATQEQILRETINKGQWKGDVVNYTSKGDKVYFRCKTQIIYDKFKQPIAICGTSTDITDQKIIEQTIRESEEFYKKKIQAILKPKGDIGILSLGEIIDSQALQSIIEVFYQITKVPVALVDISGKQLAHAGWQDICTNFHRINPESFKNCQEAATKLANGVLPGDYKAYKCKNNLWDVVTPIEINGKQMGNIFIGQFFYEDETPDYDVFRDQARKYGFDEDKYLSALDRVPRFDRKVIDAVIVFYSKFADIIASLSYSSIMLAKKLEEQRNLEKVLHENEKKLRQAHQIAKMGRWELDHKEKKLMWTDTIYDIFGLDKNSFGESYEAFLNAVHPLDRDLVDEAWQKSLIDKKPYEIEHRILLKNNKIKWVKEKCYSEFDENGKPITSVGIVIDITDKMDTEQELRKKNEQYKMITETMSDFAFAYVCDSDRCSIFWLEGAVERVTGCSAEKILKRKCWKFLIHPDDEVLFNENVLRLNPSENSSFELRILNNDKIKWLKINTRCIFDNNRNQKIIYGGCVDITSKIIFSEAVKRFSLWTVDDVDYQSITDDILLLSGAQYAILNIMHGNKSRFKTVAFSGVSKDIQKASELLGVNFIGKVWDYNPEKEEKIRKNKTAVFDNLSDLCVDIIPEKIVNSIQKLFSIEKLIFIKIAKDEEIVGNFILIFKKI